MDFTTNYQLKTGKPVRWPVQAQTFVDDNGVMERRKEPRESTERGTTK